jgi:hypothetical protein
MTTPTRTAPATSVPEQIQQHDLAALALEAAAVAAPAGVMRDQLQVLTRSWLLAWQKTFGSLHTQQSGMAFLGFMERVQHDLAHIRFDPKPALLDYAARARNLGSTPQPAWLVQPDPARSLRLPGQRHPRSRRRTRLNAPHAP